MIGDVATPLPGPLLGTFELELRALFSKRAGMSLSPEKNSRILVAPKTNLSL